MKYILISLTLGLLAACGTAPKAIQGTAPEAPSDLSAAALATDPCIGAACAWNDLGPQPLSSDPAVIVKLSLNTFQDLPVVAYDRPGPNATFDAFVQAKPGATWEAPTRLNDAGTGSDPTLAHLGSRITAQPLVAFTERRPGADSVIRLKTRSALNGAWIPFDPQSDAGLSAISTPGSFATRPSVVVTPNFIIVAWNENNPTTNQTEVFAQFYRNGVWTNLGKGPDGSVDSGFEPKLAINANNRMALSYFQSNAQGGRIAVRRWGGRTFDPVPDPSALAVNQTYSLGVASSGEPVVALTELQNPNRLIVRQRTGQNNWVTLGPPLNFDPSAFAGGPSVAVSGTQISVAWIERNTNAIQTLRIKRWNPNTLVWEAAFGDQIRENFQRGTLSLALDSVGNPLAAFSQRTGIAGNAPTELRVRAWGPAQLR